MTPPQKDQTNPKDLLGIKKPRLSLIPPAALIYEALAMGDGAKRYQSGSWPRTLPKFFDASASTPALDPLPAADRPPDYPSDGCPGAA